MSHGITLTNNQSVSVISSELIILQEILRTVVGNASAPADYDFVDSEQAKLFRLRRPYRANGTLAGLAFGGASGSSTGVQEISTSSISPSALAGNYGLAVYDQLGVLRYDSNKKIPKYLGAHNTDAAAIPGTSIPISVSKSLKSKLFFVMPAPWYYVWYNDNGGSSLNFPASFWFPRISFTSETNMTVSGEWSTPDHGHSNGYYATIGNTPMWRLHLFEV